MPRTLQDFSRDRVRSRRLPDWLKLDLAVGHESPRTDALIKGFGLHTICESGRCPNRNECYSQKTATFMIMGDVCTRSCRFCSVSTGRPGALDLDEPQRVADAAAVLGLRYVVVTSVNRDDLEDEGAGHFTEVIRRLKSELPEIVVEILTPDFKRTQSDAVRRILNERPDVFNHNVETVPGLYRRVRPQGDYEASLQIFREIRKIGADVVTKSGLMLGLGECREEVLGVLNDLREAGCEFLTLGQYLQSSASGLPVAEFVRPEIFLEYKNLAIEMGFKWVESAPFVRSSFHAGQSFEALKRRLVSGHGTVERN